MVAATGIVSLVLLACLVQAGGRILAIDDSYSRITHGIKTVRRKEIRVSTVASQQVETRGIQFTRGKISLDRSDRSIFVPANLIVDTEEEVEAMYPQAKISKDEKSYRGRIFEIEGTATHVPDAVIYGEYIKNMVVEKGIHGAYLTARGYYTREQKEILAQAVSGAGYHVRKVIPDGTAIALQAVAPGKAGKFVQTFVARGRKITVSLFKYTPKEKKDDDKESSKPLGGRLKNIYHKVYDHIDEREVQEIICSYLEDEVRKIARTSSVIGNGSLVFYPKRAAMGESLARSETSADADSSESVWQCNLQPLLNKACEEMLAKEVEEKQFITRSSIHVREVKSGTKFEICPKDGEELVIPIYPVYAQIREYARSKLEGLKAMVEEIRELTQERLKEDEDFSAEDLVVKFFCDLIPKSILQPLLEEAGLSRLEHADRKLLPEGCLHHERWMISLSDDQVYTHSASALPHYEANGEKFLTYASFIRALDEETGYEATILSFVGKSRDLLEKEVAELHGLQHLSSEERSRFIDDVEQKLPSALTRAELKKSAGMDELIRAYKGLEKLSKERGENAKKLDLKVAMIFTVAEQGRRLAAKLQGIEQLKQKLTLLEKAIEDAVRDLKPFENKSVDTIIDKSVIDKLTKVTIDLRFRIDEATRGLEEKERLEREQKEKEEKEKEEAKEKAEQEEEHEEEPEAKESEEKETESRDEEGEKGQGGFIEPELPVADLFDREASLMKEDL